MSPGIKVRVNPKFWVPTRTELKVKSSRGGIYSKRTSWNILSVWLCWPPPNRHLSKQPSVKLSAKQWLHPFRRLNSNRDLLVLFKLINPTFISAQKVVCLQHPITEILPRFYCKLGAKQKLQVPAQILGKGKGKPQRHVSLTQATIVILK